jgi:very-short-patch-repair endonuclease
MRKPEHKSRPLAKRLRKRMTNAEIILWSRLRGNERDHLFRRQHPIGPYVADFACVRKRIVIEVGGATHSGSRELAHDRQRNKFMKSRGWRVMRVLNTDIFHHIDAVLSAIFAIHPLSAAASAAPDTTPVTTGEEKRA